jgi:hypothetical protein|nr:MAG TPA: Protein of unknown function (DUF551) [Caudoviricetes sp.]
MSRNRSLEEIQEDIRTLTRVPSEFIHAKLDELAEEIGELAKPKWIPCSEKMPEDNTNVIVCFYSGTVTEMRYWGNGIFQGIYEHTAKTIVSWMPLPEPYKRRMI